MSRSDRLKEKHGKSSLLSVDIHEESAARTRPLSFEDIMLRRRNKELLENVKATAKETWNVSPGGSSEKIADRFESPRIYKHDKSSSFGREKHASEELVNVSSRKKLESAYVMENELTEGRHRAKNISEIKSSAGLNNKGRITKENTGKEICGWRIKEQISDNSEYKAGNKNSRDFINKDSYAEINSSKSERKTKKKNYIEEDENPNDYYTERKREKDRHDKWKIKKWLSNDSEELAEKKHHRDLHKDRHTEGRAKYEREIRRKYRNGDDETWERNTGKQDLEKHHNHPHIDERKNRQEKVKSHHDESTAKRRRSRSHEREDRRRFPSFSPRAHKNTHHDGERKELSTLSLKDSSRKKHSDGDRNRVSNNGSSSHHLRHGSSTSGLGGYSPRKRKSEAAVKTPSPSKHSVDKKRAGWDLPPAGTDNPSPAFPSSGFQLSNYTVLSNMNDVASATSLDPAIMKSLPVSFLNNISTGKDANIDSVQLTQATRPMRRLYLENLPASASEKDVMDCFNNLLYLASVNHIRQAQPCISCILHKDRGQALVEFLTAEDASAALSFDGSTLFGSVVKIRRPKDYVEVATGEPERSVDAAVPISDVVIDSPNKIFIGGISNHLSSEMIKEVAGAFGSLKAFHFKTKVNNGSCAFLEYVDHSVTVKACVGLNGMKLGGEVLTVVQAMPDVSPSENGGKSPSYEIPEHAKPILRKPTQVLEIKNVFTMESISSLSDMTIEEILEDVRLECARFGTVKSINLVKDSNEQNLITKFEECGVINNVDSKEASQNTPGVINNADSSFSEKATNSQLKATSGSELHYDQEIEEEDINDSGVDVDIKADEVFDNTSCQEQLVSDTTVEDAGNKSMPISIIQECPHHQDTPNDRTELHDKMVANNIDVDLKNTVCMQAGCTECDTSSELVGPRKGIDEEGDISGDIFEPGSVLVEYRRTEACCSAAHGFHRRTFDGRMVTVKYVALSLYRAKFTK